MICFINLLVFIVLVLESAQHNVNAQHINVDVDI